jgi:hypothetical protein
MTRGRIGRSILGIGAVAGVVAASAKPALAATNLNGALIERADEHRLRSLTRAPAEHRGV